MDTLHKIKNLWKSSNSRYLKSPRLKRRLIRRCLLLHIVSNPAHKNTGLETLTHIHNVLWNWNHRDDLGTVPHIYIPLSSSTHLLPSSNFNSHITYSSEKQGKWFINLVLSPPRLWNDYTGDNFAVNFIKNAEVFDRICFKSQPWARSTEIDSSSNRLAFNGLESWILIQIFQEYHYFLKEGHWELNPITSVLREETDK